MNHFADYVLFYIEEMTEMDWYIWSANLDKTA